MKQSWQSCRAGKSPIFVSAAFKKHLSRHVHLVVTRYVNPSTSTPKFFSALQGAALVLNAHHASLLPRSNDAFFFFCLPFKNIANSCKLFYNASFHISNARFCIEAALLVHYLKLGFLCSSKFHCKLACNVLSYNSRNFLLAPLYRLTADTCSYRITGNGHAPVHVAPRLVHYAHGKYCKHGKCASCQSRVCYTQQGKRKRIHATRRQKTQKTFSLTV